jgi:aspartyl-tRNA(Asn)/glutamyl-tRNA(Gln) amidotransferase subunit A
MEELLRGDIGGLRAALKSGEADAAEIAEAALARIDALAHLNAFVETRPEAVDESRRARGPLAGVPLAVKDMLADGGRIPTCGSRAHGTWVGGTATVVERLRAAGAVVVGYTNLHEWGVGMTSAVTATGPVRNPWDPELVPGGSSGGSAAALAGGMVVAATGTDAGGSIRCPSACCGTTGLKATWGRLPTEGFVGHGGAIDGVGPLARSVGDVVRLASVMADERLVPAEARTFRLGIPRSFFFDDLDPGVAAAVEAGIGVLRGAVAEVREVDLPTASTASFAVPGLLLPLFAERLADAGESSFEPPTARLLELGRGLTEGDRARAAETQAAVVADWERVFAEVDLVVTPTLPAPPAPLATLTVDLPSGPANPELAYLALNAPMNLGRVPALSLPCGWLSDSLTANLTLTAARGRDEVALGAGLAFERATDGEYAGRVAPL